MPLQPSGVPSRAAIQAAIDEAVAAHASTTDPNSQHYDSGWIDIILRANRVASGETPRYRRIGRVVYLRGRVAKSDGTNFAANTQDTIGDIAAGFRPNPLVMFALAGSNGTLSGGRFWIDTNGQVIMQPQNATPNMSVACSYLNN